MPEHTGAERAPGGGLLAADTPGAAELRRALQAMVERDLLGPAGGPEEELVDMNPRDRYLVGMLAPRRLRVAPEELDALEVQASARSDDGTGDEVGVAAPTMFPSAVGLSFCVPREVAGARVSLRVTARWGAYRRVKSETVTSEQGNPRLVWRRTQVEETLVLEELEHGPIEARALRPRLAGESRASEAPVRAQVRGVAHAVGDALVISLFLENAQDEPRRNAAEAWLFQPELAVESVDGAAVFRSRRVLDADQAEDDEEQAMAMLYRHRVEFAVGHGVSVRASVSEDPRLATRVETRVIPAHEVMLQGAPRPDEVPGLDGLELDMKVLAETPRAQLGQLLRPLTDAYERWIETQRGRVHAAEAGLSGFEDAAEDALAQCARVLARIRDGLALLSTSVEAADAFRFANRAMWLQRVHSLFAERRRRGEQVTLEQVDVRENRTWYPFQLAFLLLNLDSVTNLHHPHRSDPAAAVADLLWFPTGGGKTEAYLGLTAYTLGLRRLQGVVAGRSGEHGVAVLMRYTLRLLTLQQFQRATALMCACEAIRRQAVDDGAPVWGHEPFRIGLWVGAKSTPNKTERASESLKLTRQGKQYRQASRIAELGSPVQLESCPWCGSKIEPGRHIESLPYKNDVGRTIMYCGDKHSRCRFSRRWSPGEGLPVVVVDEEIYRRLPALLIATVDKFAQMPWNGAVQMLFGQVNGYCARHGFTSPTLRCTDHQARDRLPRVKVEERGPLRPPDLIIQDELHLISGPLGTLTGLYETAVDELCSWDVGGTRVRPKVVASTATIRRAGAQVRGLFLRDVQVFPPQGLDVGDNFFSREQPLDTRPGRLYVGISAPGRRLKAAIIRVYVAYLSAAQALFEQYGAAVDPWMTLVGYFSSLRELAGTRRLVDDDIASRVRRMAERGLANRLTRTPRELTSRMASTEIPELLDWLEMPFSPEPPGGRAGAGRNPSSSTARKPIDVLLATNMISVGVDIRRLGLMVVAGQPKNTAEYIQATSRVGRSKPGLVCTIYNWARPRDLSHYERFEHYHATFYKHVEPLSVTPFAPRSCDRGLAALLVSLVRLCGSTFNENQGAGAIERDHEVVRRAIEVISRRAERVEGKETRDRVRRELEGKRDHWVHETGRTESRLGFKREHDARALLSMAGAGAWQDFTCLNSLRDVEPTVHLVLEDGSLDQEERPFAAARPAEDAGEPVAGGQRHE